MRRWMTATAGLMTLGAVLACTNTRSGGDAMKKCYHLVEGDVETILVIEDSSLTLMEHRDGVELAPPEAFPGRVEGSAFIYPDGTTVPFDDQALTWPEGSVLAGMVFPATTCP